MVVVEGFYINIISKVWLLELKVWYLGLDSTFYFRPFANSIILIKFKYRHNLVFLKYKPIFHYSTFNFSIAGIIIFLVIKRKEFGR